MSYVHISKLLVILFNKKGSEEEMEGKDLILVKGENEVYLEKRRNRVNLRRTLTRLFLLALVVCVLLCAVFLLPRAKAFLGSGGLDMILENLGISALKKPSNQGAQGNQGTQGNQGAQGNQGGSQNNQNNQNQTQGGQNETLDTENEDEKIPSGAYKIESATKEYKITNETKIELDTSVPSLVSPFEIKNKYGGEAPLVLITHRAPKECYSNGKYYTEKSDFYSDSENIAALAKELSGKLNALGIKTLYLDEEYAKGTIYGTLNEYEKSLNEVLSRYPSISYVFSLSRGIYINDGMSLEREAVSVGGEKCAQIRIISGTGGEKMSEAQGENVSFALDFASKINESCPNFVCESKIARFPLGQNISPFALDVELGTYANTYDEAKESTHRLATFIFEYLSAVGSK